MFLPWIIACLIEKSADALDARLKQNMNLTDQRGRIKYIEMVRAGKFSRLSVAYRDFSRATQIQKGVHGVIQRLLVEIKLEKC